MLTNRDSELQDSEKIKTKDEELFDAIKGKSSPKEKLRQVVNYLNQGANLNAFDATDNNNTPLHVATRKGEVLIVKLFLERGANVTVTNDNKHTVFDIIQLPGTPNKTELANILYQKYGYQKRRGTSAVRGELYETKLLTLILFRALYLTKLNIQELILGTNIDGIGALDDIILRYKTNEGQNPKMIFLQAKHKENETLSVEDLLNPKKETSLHKYFHSYLKIREKFVTDNVNTMFEGAIKNVDCKYIIYTSAKQNISKYNSKCKKAGQEILIEETSIKDCVINTNGNIFIFKYKNDSDIINEFVSTAVRIRTALLAQKISKFIFQDNNNYKNMMVDNLVKQYHIFLIQNVIEIDNNSSRDLISDSKPDYVIGIFQKSFLYSHNENLKLLRLEICKELVKMKGLEKQDTEAETIMKTHTFKIPIDFVDYSFHFTGPESKQESRLTHLCSIFKRIFENISITDSKYAYINLDDDSVGPEELIQSKDLQNCWLGGLVGNLLILDDETEMLKFNFNNQDLSKDNIRILEKLEESYSTKQLSMFRFDINYYTFPKLSLNSLPYDRKLVKDFLSNVRIYTNQSKEDEMENILKKEINLFYSNKKRPDSLFRVKCDAIFLKVHDKVQNWWKETNLVPYLTEKCKFFDQVEQELLDNPLLTLVDFICSQKVNKTLLEFENETILLMGLNAFFNSTDTAMIITTDEINFSTVKVIQYLKTMQKESYLTIDIDYEIIINCFETLLNELEDSLIPTLIVMSRGISDSAERLLSVMRTFKGKVVIISCSIEDDGWMNMCSQNCIYRDNTNKYNHLSAKIRNMILEEREIIFQGIQVRVNTVFNDSSLQLLSPNLLSKIIHNEPIIIGKSLTDRYDVTTDNYIKRFMRRFITLSTNTDNDRRIYFMRNENDSVPPVTTDLVLITKSRETFEIICKKYTKCNVHWFIDVSSGDHKYTIWQQSRGSLEKIRNYVNRPPPSSEITSFKTDEIEFATVKDIDEKAVIINADPGMGKSTLLTHLAINTKRIYPSHWVLKINLLDNRYLEQFSNWQENDTDIDMIEVMMFLYSTIDIQYYKNDDIRKTVFDLVTVSKDDEVYISDQDSYLLEVDLSEIKLFNYFYNNNCMAVLLDGFDEISPDYTNEVIKVLHVLKNSRISHLWVTTRPYNILKKLELSLETFSYTLNPLTSIEQFRFLRRAWILKLLQDETLKTKKYAKHIDMSAFNLHKHIKKAFNENENFTSIPLHLYMIAEIYEDLLRQYVYSNSRNCKLLLKDINFVTLYEKFTNIKFEIQFEQKNPSTNSKDPYRKKMKQEAYKKFIKDHKKLAAYLILDKYIVLSEDDIESVQVFIEDIQSDSEKTGITNCIDDNPKFVHYTFAEYFAVEFIFDKLKSGNTSLWKYFIDTLLISDSRGIRRFLNFKLEHNQYIISDLSSNQKLMNTLSDMLLTQFINISPTTLYISIQEHLEYIAMLLIEISKYGLKKNNLTALTKVIPKKCDHMCFFCVGLLSQRQTIIQSLTELIEDTDIRKIERPIDGQNNDTAFIGVECVSLRSLLHLEKKSINLVAEILTKHPIHGMPASTAHWLLGIHGYLLSYCREHVLQLTEKQLQKVFSGKDNVHVNLHSILLQGNCNLLTAMELLGQKELEETCTADYNTNSNPLLALLIRVLGKALEKKRGDVKDFVYNEFPKLCSEPMVHPEKRVSPFDKRSSRSHLPNIILLRALCDDNITDFIIKTPTSPFRTDFEHIIVRYKTKNTQETKMVFLHQENILNMDKNGLIEKYLSSYLKIKNHFFEEEDDTLFQGPVKSIDYSFIIYMSTNDLSLPKTCLTYSDEENLIKTSEDGKIYQFAYTTADIDTLVSTLTHSRVIKLAKTLSQFILNTSYIVFENMSDNYLMRIYRVFLAQHVIQIDTATPEEVLDHFCENKSKDYCLGSFRRSFLVTNDVNLTTLRGQIYEEIATIEDLKLDHQLNEVKKVMETLQFQLPINYDKYSFHLYQDEAEQHNQIDNLLTTFKNLFNHVEDTNSKYIFIKVNDDSFDPEEAKQLVSKDNLAGLVGNLLIIDDETEMLKLNHQEETLTSDCLTILHHLKKDYDSLAKFRFDINVYGFPKLTLNSKEHDQETAKDFLNKLKFYTNQGDEDEMTNVLKSDINRLIINEKKQNEFHFRVKCDAIAFSDLWIRNKCRGNDGGASGIYSTEALNWMVTDQN